MLPYSSFCTSLNLVAVRVATRASTEYSKLENEASVLRESCTQPQHVIMRFSGEKDVVQKLAKPMEQQNVPTSKGSHPNNGEHTHANTFGCRGRSTDALNTNHIP